MIVKRKMAGMMRRMTMSGKTNLTASFLTSYNRQIRFQKEVTGAKCPGDNLHQFSYHIQAMVEELGEVMKADKRWKTHRNERYEPDEKLDEIADVFITAMNIAIHSGFTAEEIEHAIEHKISENFERLAIAKEEEE